MPLAVAILATTLVGCDYVWLLRPSALKQLDPRVVRLVDELPELDEPNKAIVARLFPHGGLSHATLGSDGAMRDRIRVPPDPFLWKPAIIVMEGGGELELEFQNEDHDVHTAFLPNNGAREVVGLPVHSGARARIRLDQPGLYWFGCPSRTTPDAACSAP